MNKKVFWLSLIAVLVSFIGGFLVANALNRREMDELRAEIARLKNNPQASPENAADQTLSDEEIREKIAEADKSPENIEYQKSLAMALYRYSSMKQEPKWLGEVVRLLTRVHEKNPNDYNTIVSLGNLYFDQSQTPGKAENESNNDLGRAREFYQKALTINGKDANVRADLGLSYLLNKPADNARAIAEFQKSLQDNPREEKALEGLIRAQLNEGNKKEAETNLGKLKQLNPGNRSLSELETKLGDK